MNRELEVVPSSQVLAEQCFANLAAIPSLVVQEANGNRDATVRRLREFASALMQWAEAFAQRADDWEHPW
jgi:hypothetical protein